MTFHDEIEARYQVCKDKTNATRWDQDPQWYVAYSILALLRGAAKDGVLKDQPGDFVDIRDRKGPDGR